jgi:hypothetical protein
MYVHSVFYLRFGVAMSHVHLRNSNLSFDATEVGDNSQYDAEDFAKNLVKQRKSFHMAVVDRFDGLVIIGRSDTYHFKTVLCGYRGNGADATVKILQMLGFDTDRHLKEGALLTGNNLGYAILEK